LKQRGFAKGFPEEEQEFLTTKLSVSLKERLPPVSVEKGPIGSTILKLGADQIDNNTPVDLVFFPFCRLMFSLDSLERFTQFLVTHSELFLDFLVTLFDYFGLFLQSCD